MAQKNSIFKTYLKKLTDVTQTGDAREESLYPALRDLIQAVAQVMRRPEIQVTIQPPPTEAGNPDFRIWDGTSRRVG
ncbi:MAG: hypothetical protein N3C12_14990 [Candidatus Binatia bacterium]|nr:hypothetical protein [Candidatus Binatia bacterium]